jgi:MFS-type transporter involved in bile tolerance (Atg22 family)
MTAAMGIVGQTAVPLIGDSIGDPQAIGSYSLGGAAERPLLLTLVPDLEAGRFLSLMVLSSRAAAILGPFIWAFTVDGLLPSFGTGIACRAGIVTVALGMLASLALLWGVPNNWGKNAAA